MIFGGFNDIPMKDFRRIIETNLFEIIYGARAALQQFRSSECFIDGSFYMAKKEGLLLVRPGRVV